MDIYQEIILDHYKNPRNFNKEIGKKDAVEVANLSCGDKVVMKVKLKKDVVEEIECFAEGCVISVASASIVSEYAKHKSKGALLALNSGSMSELLGVQLSPNRLKCALISLEALQRALQQYL